MDKSRLEFHTFLESCIGSNLVYFQPPPNIIIEYPCIIYSYEKDNVTYADNIKYFNKRKYKVTYIDRNPDSKIIDVLSNSVYSTFLTHFVNDNLYHYVFEIYFKKG